MISNGCSGATLNFVNVKNLNLANFRIKDSVAFHIRMSVIENFHIKNIGFYSEALLPNQDGIHIGGFVKNGIIENIKAESTGQTNDDLIALNADDSVERVDNFDLKRGPIENIIIRNIFAEECHTFIRMLSVDAPIRNINVSHINGKGGTCHGFIAINPAAFGNAMEIKKYLSKFLKELRESPKAEGQNRIYTHGEKEIEAYDDRLKNGISLNSGTISEIKNLCDYLNIKFDFVNDDIILINNESSYN